MQRHLKSYISPDEQADESCVLDFNASEMTCPACGASFQTGPSECPDCGLFLGN